MLDQKIIDGEVYLWYSSYYMKHHAMQAAEYLRNQNKKARIIPGVLVDNRYQSNGEVFDVYWRPRD